MNKDENLENWLNKGQELTFPPDPDDTRQNVTATWIQEAIEKMERVKSIHQPSLNSTSALHPVPLCEGCGENYPCTTVKALSEG